MLLDGKLTSQSVKKSLKEQTDLLTASGKRPPHLAAVLVGDDGASETYVANKVKACSEIGFRSTLIRLDSAAAEQALLDQIAVLNNDDEIDGILVQLPLPSQISEQKVIEAIRPEKDVDGFSPVSVGKMVQGLDTFIPATPYGIMLMLEEYQIETSGKHAVVIGRSNIVGRPMSILLSSNTRYGNCTVTLCHSRTTNLTQLCRHADIIVAALGRPGFVTAEMVKEGAIVLDVGITRVKDSSTKSGFRLKGDVDFDQVAPIAAAITPVPGGVGPMTIVGLMKNTLQAYLRRFNLSADLS